MKRRSLLGLGAAAFSVAVLPALPVQAATNPSDVITTWYRLVLELVRHTATYSPPVASRAFAYLGITSYESLAALTPKLTSFAGQLTDLSPLPKAEPAPYDAAVVLHAALTDAVRYFFGNTGPTGQRAMDAMEKQIGTAMADIDTDVATRSMVLGKAIADHIIAWSETDGGAKIDNMGFPMEYTLTEGPAHWVPTSMIRMQQTPLLPNWGKNRTFALATGATCTLPPPLEYSEDPESEFYKQAKEVYDIKANLTDEQKKTARFWSDDPMLSPTPPGHWISITLEIILAQGLDAAHAADALARVGIAVADAFIACWQSKFEFDLLRPVTYIRRVIDPKWDPLLITPPFPEYPSGHSLQSGAAATVLGAIFGAEFAFTDATHVDDGIPERHFPTFWAAAEEAAMSRMYGGIHFRAANERGLEQGRCVGASAVALRTLS